MLKRNTLKTIAVCALLVSAGNLLTACSKGKPEFRGVDISEVDYARDIQLPDHNGQQRSLKDFKGKVVVVFFGYAVPRRMPDLHAGDGRGQAHAGQGRRPPQSIFVTVDPERDTAEMLKAYMGNFDPSFLALHWNA